MWMVLGRVTITVLKLQITPILVGLTDSITGKCLYHVKVGYL